MKYTKVYIESFGYEIAPNVVTTAEIEQQLMPFYNAVGLKPGQLEAITGIRERRYWDINHTLAEHAAVAGQKALDAADISADQINTLVYCGVCKDGFEPATACNVAEILKVGRNAQVFDIQNACLGMITGMVTVANEIELGNIKAGLVVSCETARQIVDSTIDEINSHKSIDFYKKTMATLTGGSGAVAVLLTDGSLGRPVQQRHAVKGGVVRNAIQYNGLCQWKFEEKGMPTTARVIMRTDAHGVMEHGLKLLFDTFMDFKQEFNLSDDKPDKFIGHQIGSTHHQKSYQILSQDRKKDFCTYPFLGNVGSVALPITAAIADEQGFFTKDDFVAFVGAGSGMNCYILGIEW
jgi:3-oxoacyl-[acyl-carrier-protein] synthase-3